MKAVTASTPRGGLALVLLCFFGSGITGLVYQVLWVRMLEQVVGAAPFAIAIVLAVFMAGLGLGSLLASRRIDALPPATLLRGYGLLELGIGLCALFIPLLLFLLHPAYAFLYRALSGHLLLFNAATCALAGLALLLPTTMMGATLPLLCRFAITDGGGVGRRTGLLYGLNTLGAALGALLAGMVLLPALGVRLTLGVAVLVNGLIGAGCLLLARQTGGANLTVVGARARNRRERSRPAEAEAVALPAIGPGVPYLIMAVAGFASLAYEVILTRLLTVIVGPTTYSFTVVLVTFITGLALGSLVFGWLADRVARPDLLLLWSQLGAAGTMLVASQLLGDSQFFFAKLLFRFQGSFAGQQAVKAAALFGYLIIPTVCLGATFPLVARLLARTPERIGRVLGVGYAINTAGCVLGSVVAGFVLIPLLGKEWGLSLVIAIQLLAMLACTLRLAGDRPRQRLALGALAVVGLVGAGVMPRWNHLHLATSKYHRFTQLVPLLTQHGWLEAIARGPTILSRLDQGELLYYGEGIGGFTTVIRTADLVGNPELAMANSGKFDASSVGDMKTQVLLAHIPMLAHRAPRDVMVLGLGSGITAGEALRYPSVERLDVVEIGDQVVRASRQFEAFNNHVLDSPKTHVIVQDARAHLALSGRSYDVVISEPSNPWMAGMASLFTREFFQLVRRQLRPGGIYVQFIHTYEIDWTSLALVLRTFHDVFPSAVLVATHPSRQGADYLMVGFADSTARFALDTSEHARAVVRSSANFRLADPSLLYRLLVTDDLATLAGPGPANTEDRPILEFAAPRSLYQGDGTIQARIRDGSHLSAELRARMDAREADPEAGLAFADFALSLRTPFAGMEPAKMSAAQLLRFTTMISGYAGRYQADCSLFRMDAVAKECFREQLLAMEGGTSRLTPTALTYLSDLHVQAGRQTQARADLEAALKQDPNALLALSAFGILAAKESQYLEAIEYLERARSLNPWLPGTHVNLGIAYLRTGNKPLAARSFRAALQLDPSSQMAAQGLQLSTR